MLYRKSLSHTKFILFFPLIFSVYCFSQEFEKEKIYLKFKIEKDCSRKMKFYHKKEKGIVFNIYCKKNGTFLFEDSSKADTLSLRHLKDYRRSTMGDIEALEKRWRIKNKQKFIDLFGSPYPLYDKNGIFNTYIIEVLEDSEQFILYPVKWRGLGNKSVE